MHYLTLTMLILHTLQYYYSHKSSFDSKLQIGYH